MQSRHSADLLAHTIVETTLGAVHDRDRARRLQRRTSVVIASAALALLVATAAQLWPA